MQECQFHAQTFPQVWLWHLFLPSQNLTNLNIPPEESPQFRLWHRPKSITLVMWPSCLVPSHTRHCDIPLVSFPGDVIVLSCRGPIPKEDCNILLRPALTQCNSSAWVLCTEDIVTHHCSQHHSAMNFFYQHSTHRRDGNIYLAQYSGDVTLLPGSDHR